MKLIPKHRNRVLSLILAITLIVTLISTVIAEIQWPETLNRFERYNPVYSQTVDNGTQRGDLTLPEHLRAEVSIPEEIDLSTFTQAQPEADTSDGYESYDYYWYGYIAPKNVEELYKNGELAIYTISYADKDNDNVTDKVEYRVYGSVEGSETLWFTCDEQGNITGAILDVPVIWSGDYDAQTAGEYTFKATVDPQSAYSWNGKKPIATVIVKEAAASGDETAADIHEASSEGEDVSQNITENEPIEQIPDEVVADGATQEEIIDDVVSLNFPCSCGGENTPNAWEHALDCENYSPIECMCREKIEEDELVEEEDGSSHYEKVIVSGDFTHVHNNEDKDCPLNGTKTIDFTKENGDKSVMAFDEANKIAAAQENGEVLYPALGKIELIAGSEQNAKLSIGTRSINGGGTQDVKGDTAMRNEIATTGNSSFLSNYTGNVTIPGTWVDYINTIWMNKAYNKFAWTPAASTSSQSNWSWNGTIANVTVGTVTNNAARIPVKSGTTWTVYSGQQLKYALTNLVSGDTVKLGANINLNGSNYSWGVSNMAKKGLIIDGNNKTIYNLGCSDLSDASTSASYDKFISNYVAITVKNLTFKTAKIVSYVKGVGIFDTRHANGVENLQSFQNVNIEDSMMAAVTGETVSPFGSIGGSNGATNYNYCVVSQCTTSGNFLYGSDHMSGFGYLGNGYAKGTTYRWSSATNCYSVNNLLCGYGGHSAGFQSCSGENITITNCFTNNEIYGSAAVGGFAGGMNCNITDCYSSGKIEGYQFLGGFTFTFGGTVNTLYRNDRVFRRCYSTTLVGLRSNPAYQGGFIENMMPSEVELSTISTFMYDCYAAGEVGNHDLNTTTNQNVGGFLGAAENASTRHTYSRCYYDKQTTAMREWTAGYSKTRSGVTGVLTSTTNKSGTGLASGTYGTTGFTGFTDNTKWTYTAQQYPQLAVFSGATAANWGSDAKANVVKANSLASTSTVFLDTWDTGYDWDDTGIRTENKVSYGRTLASTGKTSHKGYTNTYDTVREIVTDAPVTSTATWSHMIAGGAPTDTNGDGISDGNSLEVTGANGIVVEKPGMDWYKISRTVSNQTGFRPIRLTAYMNLEAGDDKNIAAGASYDHRKDVSMTMLDSVKQDLVVGLDDAKIWSSSKTGGYPNSKKYWALPTTNMETPFEASEDAWIYTSIWRAKQTSAGIYETDANGNYVPDLAAKVTGPGTGNGTTMTEQKWNGEVPLYPDTSIARKYVVSYYWMLSDGRYRTDYKVITLEPGEYEISVNVKNANNNTANNKSLHLASGIDYYTSTTSIPSYTYSFATTDQASTTGVAYTKNSSLAWKKKNSLVTVTKYQLTMTTPEGVVMGTVTGTGDLKTGDEIIIPVSYYYNNYLTADPYTQEELSIETLNISYTVKEDASGGHYLHFNKLINAPSDEYAPALIGGESTGIPSGALAYINDTQYNINLTLWVTDTTPNGKLSIMKIVDNHTDELEDQNFIIKLSGGVNRQMTLGHYGYLDEISYYAEDGGLVFDITESVPMEYNLKDITFSNWGTGTDPKVTLKRDSENKITGATVTIYPGNDAKIFVINEFEHEGYFKSRSSVENFFRRGYNP